MAIQRFAYFLIAIGFLAGSYFSVIDTEGVAWPGVVPALAIGIAGVAIVQMRLRSTQRTAEKVRSSIETIEASLARIASNAAELDASKESVDTYEIRHRIDDLFMGDLNTFVENRESISHAFGLQPYAEVMTSFATGERYLNRCWSASTDGYIDEVHAYLARARVQFDEALALLRRLRAAPPT